MIYALNKTDTGYFLKIEGDLDLYSSYNLKEEVKDVYSKAPLDIFIDLSQVNYIDSTGIGFLIDIKRNANQNNKQCKVINVPKDILHMFKTLGVDVILQI